MQNLESLNMEDWLPDAKNSLRSNGFAITRGLIDEDEWIVPLWLDLCSLAQLCAQRRGVVSTPPGGSSLQEMNQWLMLLFKQDRRICADLYDAAKQMPSFLRLAISGLFEEIYSKLIDTSMVGVGENSYGIRFDLPSEEKFRSHWHQEYAYNPQSPNLLVFWVPLVIMEPDMGSVELLEGSHNLGCIRHEALPEYSHKSGLYKTGMRFADDYEKQFEKVIPRTKPGDLVILDSRTVHQSGVNRSKKLRVTMQVRYFGFDNEQAVKDGWPSKPSNFFDYDVGGKK